MGSSFRAKDKKFTGQIPTTVGKGKAIGIWGINDHKIHPMHIGCTSSWLGSDSGKKNPPKRENNKKRNK